MSEEPEYEVIPETNAQIVAYKPMSLTPQEAGDKAKVAAKATLDLVDSSGRKKLIIGKGENAKRYFYFEEWQTLGVFAGSIYGGPVTAKVVWTKDIENGYEARAVALCNGFEISAAEAICLDNEENWRGKPKYSIKSMAQTRACAKALRIVLAWVVILAGVEPTPAEEMQGMENMSKKRPIEKKTLPVGDIQKEVKDPEGKPSDKQIGFQEKLFGLIEKDELEYCKDTLAKHMEIKRGADGKFMGLNRGLVAQMIDLTMKYILNTYLDKLTYPPDRSVILNNHNISLATDSKINATDFYACLGEIKGKLEGA